MGGLSKKNMTRIGFRASGSTSSTASDDQPITVRVDGDVTRDSAASAQLHPSPPSSRGLMASVQARVQSSRCRRSKTQKRVVHHPEDGPSVWSGAKRLDFDLKDTVMAVAISADNAMFAGGGQSLRASVFSSHSGELVSSSTFPSPVTGLAFALGHRFLMVAAMKGTVRASSRAPRVPRADGGSGRPLSHGSARRAAVPTRARLPRPPPQVHMVHAERGEDLAQAQAPSGLAVLALSADGRVLIVGGEVGR